MEHRPDRDSYDRIMSYVGRLWSEISSYTLFGVAKAPQMDVGSPFGSPKNPQAKWYQLQGPKISFVGLYILHGSLVTDL